MSQTVTLRLPEQIYKQLKQAAEAMQQPLEAAVMWAVQAGLPPSVEDLPVEYREEFATMTRLSDEELWAIAKSSLPEAQQRKLSQLLRKNQANTLTDRERQTLQDLHQTASLLTLRKAHAYALLKWRNRRMPTLADLQR